MLSNLTLSYEVRTPDNRFFLPEGTVITPKVMEKVVSEGKKSSHPSYFILEYGTTKKDLLLCMEEAPFDTVFSPKERLDEVLKLMEHVRLSLPVLEFLDYFKENDFHTYSHSLMVFALTTILAREAVPEYERLIRETIAGSTHDLGKLCVPLKILMKGKPLTQREFSILRNHTTAGYILLSHYLKDSENISTRLARDHHERRNGSGYPRGINLQDTMTEIVAVSDVYHALISSRPYRPVSFDNRTALEELTDMAERNEFSLNIVRMMISLNRKDKPRYDELKIPAEKRGTPPPGNLYGLIAEDEEDE
jgi:HD-GYP domain-containing protein (c-di-GMP phosphodiesterase class II)